MQEPKCECGRAKSAHNMLSLVARPGCVANGPYAGPDGQVFCAKYREVASGRERA